MDTRTLTQGDGPPAVEVTLEDWTAEHGPLWPDVALVIAVDVCAQASRTTDSELDAVIGSLHITRVIRGSTGGWAWKPTRATSSTAGTIDADVIERLGALLFHAVTGHPVADALGEGSAVRTRLRSLRPDLAPPVADIIVRALSTRQSRPWPLDVFARDVSQVLGRASSGERPRRWRGPALVTALAALALAVAIGWNARATEKVESHGLTRSETVLVDVSEERAQGFALMDEHTAAIQEYQQLARWWGARVPPDDPRLAWNVVHEAWVRTLRGDRLTTEQQLGSVDTSAGPGSVDGTTARLTATLGDRHPYTRAARLELAATLEARGALAQATLLREQAERGARQLIGDTSVLLGGIPAPPGVFAHTAPNAPEREGFRRSGGGAFFVPLTSIQRLFSGRDGWRLHVIASGACRISVVVGDAPRLVHVTTTQAEDKRWRVGIDGTSPLVNLNGLSGDTVVLSLIADASGAVQVRLSGHEAVRTVVDAAARPPDPPYSLAFSGGADGSGCDLVWLEIPFPFEPKS